MLKAGRVSIDGITERDGAKKIDPEKQAILLDGESVKALSKLSKFALLLWDSLHYPLDESFYDLPASIFLASSFIMSTKPSTLHLPDPL